MNNLRKVKNSNARADRALFSLVGGCWDDSCILCCFPHGTVARETRQWPSVPFIEPKSQNLISKAQWLSLVTCPRPALSLCVWPSSLIFRGGKDYEGIVYSLKVSSVCLPRPCRYMYIWVWEWGVYFHMFPWNQPTKNEWVDEVILTTLWLGTDFYSEAVDRVKKTNQQQQ